MSNIAIMGGTFNPIHMGHLLIAERVYASSEYDSIMFLASKTPPHKELSEVISAEHRLRMVQLAIMGNPHFTVNPIELEREGVTYTVDTITQLKNENPEDHYFYIIGTDSLMELDKWMNFRRLAEICTFILVNRLGYNNTSIESKIEYLVKEYGMNLKFLAIPYIEISSTDIRKQIANGYSVRYMLPDKVNAYIIKKKLYQTSPIKLPKQVEKFELRLSKSLSPKRFEHSLGVKETAISLAKTYHCNVMDAAIAGILHDCAKNFSDKKKLALCARYQISLSDAEKKNLDLVHAKLGAVLAKEVFKIQSEDIYNAIMYHTTGRPNMSLLEKIIYVSDYIEPTRDKAPRLDELRETARYSLDKVLYLILEDTTAYLESRDKVIDQRTYEAYQFYKNLRIEEQKNGSED